MTQQHLIQPDVHVGTPFGPFTPAVPAVLHGGASTVHSRAADPRRWASFERLTWLGRAWSRAVGPCALLALLLGAHAAAASGCVGVYLTTNPGASNIEIYNPVSQSVKIVASPVQGSPASVNGLAVSPTTGLLYYVDRSVATTNDLWSFNPNTFVYTKIAAVPLPATGAVNVGATFDNSGTLWLMYNNYALQNVNPGSGAVISTTTVSLPATDTSGNTINKASASGTTSGDVAYDGSGQAWIVLDGHDVTANADRTYIARITLSAATTVTASSASRLNVSGTPILYKTTNGLSINPVNNSAYISYTNGSANQIAAVTLTTGALVNSGTGARSNSDMSDCGVAPSPPTVSKSFSASSGSGKSAGVVTLTLSLGNSNPVPVYLHSSLTDSLPGGMTVAATPQIGGTCPAAGVTAAPGSGTVSYAADQPVPAGGCTITVSVTVGATGSYVNSVPANGLVTGAGNNATATSATYTYTALPNISLGKTQANLTTGTAAGTGTITVMPANVIEYCLNVSNSGTGTARNVLLRDTLNASLSALPASYGSGQDLKLTVNGVVSYRTFSATDSDGTVLSGQNLQVAVSNLSAADTGSACFQVKVK